MNAAAPLGSKTGFVLGAATLVLVAAVWFFRSDSTPTTDAAIAHAEPDSARFRPPGEAGKPFIELTADHQLARVQHKDSHGLAALELVETPQGVVTIQRTFSTSGALLKEEALLNGEVVAVPRH